MGGGPGGSASPEDITGGAAGLREGADKEGRTGLGHGLLLGEDNED